MTISCMRWRKKQAKAGVNPEVLRCAQDDSKNRRRQEPPQVLRLRCSQSAVSNFAQDDNILYAVEEETGKGRCKSGGSSLRSGRQQKQATARTTAGPSTALLTERREQLRSG